MPRFFVPSDNINGKLIRITGSDAAHISRSLRMAVGDAVTVCDMHSVEHECEISAFVNGDVELKILRSEKGKTEPPYKVTLFQALPKGDKMDTIVQKAVETGVYNVIPFISERCISRPDSKALKNKLERWNKIALEAAKQCGRGIIPKVGEALSFKTAMREAAKADIPILFYEGDNVLPLKQILLQAKPNSSISIIVGAEGGFSIDEVEFAENTGLLPTGLGPRILRCETASGVALSAISYALEL